MFLERRGDDYRWSRLELGAAAGFAGVQVHDKPDWREAERVMWEAALAAPADPDPAVQSLQAEGRRSLETFGSLRRVFATATAP